MAMAVPAGARAAAGATGRKSAAKSVAGGGKKGLLGGAAADAAGDLPRPKRPDPKSGAKKKSAGGRMRGSVGKWRRVLIAEFIVCVMLLALSPLAKGRGEMGPVRFMKRGSATCAFFIILGLISSGGKGAAKASAAFGGLVTLVLLVDQREVFGKLATTLNEDKDDDAEAASAGAGPDDSTESEEGGGVFDA